MNLLVLWQTTVNMLTLHPDQTQEMAETEQAASASRNATGANTLDSGVHNNGPTSTFESLIPMLGVTTNSRSATTIGSLPNELLAAIFGYLDTSPPSASDLLEEPTFDLLNSDLQNLKAISLVSKRWRDAILPELYKHCRFIVHQSRSTPRPVLKIEIQPFLRFLRKKSLGKVVTSFALVVEDENVSHNADGVKELNGFASFWMALFETLDPIEILIIAHAEALGALTSCPVNLEDRWSFDAPCHYLRLQQPPVEISSMSHTSKTGSSNSASISLRDYDSKVISSEPVHNSSADLLRRPLLDTSPQATQQTVPQAEASSSQPPTDPLHELESERAETSALLKIRPWSTLLLNEGSFVKAYSTWEFWLRQAPSILPELLEADEDTPHLTYIPSTVREFSYIGIFPQASHFHLLTKNLPRLDRLYVQLVPRNDILENEDRMAQVESEDLWMQRNSCYALLMRELFNAPPIQNYKYLQIFESGDAADKDAWFMAVEYVKRSGNGWKIAGDGVFIRDPKDLVPAPAEGADVEDGSSFQGSLIRWAWNGTKKLPVSAYPLYDRPMGPVM